MTTPPDYDVIYMGEERQPLVVIDNFFSEPERLVEHAATQSFGGGGQFYPGIRTPAPFDYLGSRVDVIKSVFSDVFKCPGGINITESNYSIVTRRSEELMPIQSLPHFDGFDPNRFAILHYLCGPEQGGTAFYRQKATGFETVTEDRYAAYKTNLESQVSDLGKMPQGYFHGQYGLFERIHKVDAQFNRLVIYRGITLHSGHIPDDFIPKADPRTGRLTLNIFCDGSPGFS